MTVPVFRGEVGEVLRQASAVIGRPGRPFAVVGITVVNGRITEMDFVLDPSKLARITVE